MEHEIIFTPYVQTDIVILIGISHTVIREGNKDQAFKPKSIVIEMPDGTWIDVQTLVEERDFYKEKALEYDSELPA